MKTCLPKIAEDFSTLFSYQWYKGFPVDGWNRENGATSDWTTHTAITFRNTADLLGYFVHFESGGKKSDAVLRDKTGEKNIAFAEWEWKSPVKGINEPEKLSDAYLKHEPEFCFLLTYVAENALPKVVKEIEQTWPHKGSLILGIVTYEGEATRAFKDMVFLHISSGKANEFRRQPALPWLIEGTRWHFES